MKTLPEHPQSEPVIDLTHTEASVTTRVLDLPGVRFGPPFLLLVLAALLASGLLLVAVVATIALGVGAWGVNIPVAWGFAIINFVWWVGIGHAGTLISAILLLARQPWRNSVNRLAETMTLVAVANAGLYPLLHLGRIWKFYYLLPYPDTMGLWPQWRSPLVWDVFAVMTYLLVSLLFWYVGLIPDLASVRDHSPRPWVRKVAGAFALGWRNSARHWKHHQQFYLIMAGLATPLVVSVHSIVSLDFATAIVPGWHSTVFPPYFVAGAIFSGFSMVLTLLIPIRRLLKLHDIILPRHLNSMGVVMLTAGLIVAYGYVFEAFSEWLSGEPSELHRLWMRIGGSYAPGFWCVVVCNVVIAQLLWFRRVRTSPLALFGVSFSINIGMWLERFDIVVTSLHQGFMPSMWGRYVPTLWDWALLLGTIGFFALVILLFVRLLPMAPMYELRELVHAAPAVPHQRCEQEPPPTHRGAPNGLAARYAATDQLVQGIAAARRMGCRDLDALTPTPQPQVAEALGATSRTLPIVMAVGGGLAGLGAFWMMAHSSLHDYPFHIAGKPLFSWPSWVPITFELTVLGAAFTGFAYLLYLTRLPRLHHPLFDVPGIEACSRDTSFLVVSDPGDHNLPHVSDTLRATGAASVHPVFAEQ